MPPFRKWNLNYAPTHPFDCKNLGRRSRFRSNNRCRNAQAPRTERYTLRHVARRRCQDSPIQLVARSERHYVRRSTNLERANWLKVLKLQVQICGSVDVAANERRTKSDGCDV